MIATEPPGSEHDQRSIASSIHSSRASGMLSLYELGMVLPNIRQSIFFETDFTKLSHSQETQWNSYWTRRAQSKLKLYQLFGQHAPLDVRYEEIREHGLQAMLQSTIPMCYFLKSLLEQQSFENLLFYLEVDQFQGHEFADRDDMQSAAIDIFRAFLQRNSEFEVNLDGGVKRNVKRLIRQGNEKCFAMAKEHIQGLMEPCFITFLNSPTWIRMQKDLAGQVVPYHDEVRERALMVLVEYLDETLPVRQPEGQKISKEQKRRNKIIRDLLHTFARTRINLDFKDLSPKLEAELNRKGITQFEDDADVYDSDDPGAAQMEDYMKIVEALSRRRVSNTRTTSSG